MLVVTPSDPSRSSPHRPTDSTLRPLRGIRFGGRHRCSLPTYSAITHTWNAPAQQQQKTITSAAEAWKVALLCGHHLDRLHVLAMASVVRLNGGPIDRILEGLMVCRSRGRPAASSRRGRPPPASASCRIGSCTRCRVWWLCRPANGEGTSAPFFLFLSCFGFFFSLLLRI